MNDSSSTTGLGGTEAAIAAVVKFIAGQVSRRLVKSGDAGITNTHWRFSKASPQADLLRS
jgi:hypothetical protein